ncbi:HEPN domain-containing protein [uncultured Methanobrevibacter sp.]|uniref:HEPN domain-containing protein n=1 Tax=uncultured Methanobrevibacter sp. TaxID=253161 RepID=UPI00262797FC|nr:HEPN domain-containing protein [uncultured Methanobrevibacter sp.]
MASFKFDKYYNVAKHLQDHSTDEEYQRSSISRYYYSVFHPAKQYYEDSFRRTLPSDHAHTILIDALENSPFEKEKELGEKLKILKRNRVHADYRKSELRDNQLKTSKKKAEEIFILLDELIKHPVRLMKN